MSDPSPEAAASEPAVGLRPLKARPKLFLGLLAVFVVWIALLALLNAAT